MTQAKDIAALVPERIELLPRGEVMRRFENAVASLAIEGFAFSPQERAFFEQMIGEGLSEDEMLARLDRADGYAERLAAE